MTQQTSDDVLMGGGGPPSAKLTEGVTIKGRIVAVSEPYQEREYDKNNLGNGPLKYFKSGNPIMTFNVDLQTDVRDASIEDDDGMRRLYMDGARIKKAVRTAVQAAGAGGLEVGATLSITCTHYDTPGDVRSGKNYQVTYTKGNPADAVLMNDHEPQQAQPAPQQPQASAPAPAPQASGPTQEQIAAVRAAGLDPDQVFGGQQAVDPPF